MIRYTDKHGAYCAGDYRNLYLCHCAISPTAANMADMELNVNLPSVLQRHVSLCSVMCVCVCACSHRQRNHVFTALINLASFGPKVFGTGQLDKCVRAFFSSLFLIAFEDWNDDAMLVMRHAWWWLLLSFKIWEICLFWVKHFHEKGDCFAALNVCIQSNEDNDNTLERNTSEQLAFDLEAPNGILIGRTCGFCMINHFKLLLPVCISFHSTMSPLFYRLALERVNRFYFLFLIFCLFAFKFP